MPDETYFIQELEDQSKRRWACTWELPFARDPQKKKGSTHGGKRSVFHKYTSASLPPLQMNSKVQQGVGPPIPKNPNIPNSHSAKVPLHSYPVPWWYLYQHDIPTPKWVGKPEENKRMRQEDGTSIPPAFVHHDVKLCELIYGQVFSLPSYFHTYFCFLLHSTVSS